MTETPETVWVTKYALTDGIKEVPVIRIDPDGYAAVRYAGSPSYGLGLSKGDWHTTREAAVARAEQMRAAKLASLDKQAERIRGLVF